MVRRVALLTSYPGELVMPVLAVAEAAFMIEGRLGVRAEALFIADLAGSDISVADVPPSEWVRIGELVATYADMNLGTVNASVVAAAERLGITAVATTDRRHFSVVRPSHAAAFELPLLD